jgi:DNA mismatch repair protein MutS2
MNQHTFDVLEFSRVVDEVLEYCATVPGFHRLASDRPRTTIEGVALLHRQVTEWRSLEEGTDPFSEAPLLDPEDILGRLSREGTVLEGHELTGIRRLATTARRAFSAIRGAEEVPELAALVEGAPDLSETTKAIGAVLDNDGEVKDSAVPALKQLRQTLIRSRKTLQKEAQRFIQDPARRQIWTSDQPVIRDGRIVLPLSANHQGAVKGIVHEQSGTGQTVYIEPFDLVETNNQVRRTLDQIAAEVQRVLRELSDRVRRDIPELRQVFDLLGQIDAIQARGRYGRIHDTLFPDLGPRIELRGARHPMLGAGAVPIDVYFEDGKRLLIITGPNTGGKTVALKTVGLLALMSQFGIPVPVDPKSVLPVFDGIFADIGDEQSISQSLSTFSGHMTNIASILKAAGRQTLVLLDELGAGTDPEEGSALAMAVLDRLRSAGCWVLVSSHHTALKHYAYREEGCVNASVDFDEARLVPTYRLRIGIPGESHAIRIAERTGVPADVTENATEYVREGQTEGTRLINALAAQKAAVEELEEELRKEQQALRREGARLSEQAERLSGREQELLQRERQALEGFLSEARKKIERTVREVTESRRSHPVGEARGVVEEVAGALEERKEQLAARQTKAEADRKYHFSPGDAVKMKSTGVRGVLKERAGSKSWYVQTSSLRFVVKESELIPDPAGNALPATGRVHVEAPQGTVPFQIDLRGERLEEALKKVQQQLDAALVSGTSSFSIVHGKGNGVLQEGVRRLLREHEDILDFEYAPPDQGGHGKTVVHLTVLQ